MRILKIHSVGALHRSVSALMANELDGVRPRGLSQFRKLLKAPWNLTVAEMWAVATVQGQRCEQLVDALPWVDPPEVA